MDDVFQLGWNLRVQSDRWGGRSVQNGFEDHTAGIASKWHGAGTHLVENGAKREQVSARFQFLATHLLWRHISDSAQRRARTGELLLVHRGHGLLRPSL